MVVVAPASRPASSGPPWPRPPATRSTSSATRTRVTPARSWTAACSRATPSGCSRAWPSRPSPSMPTRATSTAARSTRWRCKRLRTAIRLAQRAGYLGDSIMDTSFGFSVQIRLGAGAFVCGEETALIASVEGRRGTPRPRPPYPAVSGLWGSPTLINNVESLASVADHPARRPREVRRHRRGQVEGHQGLRARWPRRQHRHGRGAHGHDPARDHLRHRRRHHRRPALQGRADRWPLGRLHPGRAPRHAGQLRDPHRARLVHGLGRHDRHGRHVLHGRRGQVLPGLLSRRVVRQVHALSRGHHADVHAPRP